MRTVAPKHHHMPLSGGDRKALTKELSKSRAMTKIFAERSAEKRREDEALIREADNLACQSWNERMWSDGGPIDPSPTIDQAINGGYPCLEIKCSRCQTLRDVDLCALRHVPTTCVHDLAVRLVCQKCKGAGKRPAATLLQLVPRQPHRPPERLEAGHAPT
jgi:hypothetical protein